jgi:hypothetical protein
MARSNHFRLIINLKLHLLFLTLQSNELYYVYNIVLPFNFQDKINKFILVKNNGGRAEI